MNKAYYFHFTIGPVQGFVAQARRTRDFWAGSFILSWLSAVAIKSVQVQGGEVKFPHADPNYMDWLIGEGTQKMPTQGSIPNRFKSLVAEVDPLSFNPDAVTQAINEAWRVLADTVWETDLGHMSPSSETADIWERQVTAFWDVSWVITKDVNNSSALDQRKNWRSYAPPNESGVKCAMMDGWQELSGEQRPDRQKMNATLWSSLRNEGESGMQSDLKPDEALCAMAFIKRRFSRHFHRIDHTMDQGWRLCGWQVPSAVPSVSYMAAVHWLEQVSAQAGETKLKVFQEEAHKLMGSYGEWETDIKCLKKADGLRYLKSLDGNVFFESFLENKKVFEDQVQAKKVKAALSQLRVTENGKLPQPSPFYAVLMMDGDSLGSYMSNPALHYSITRGLSDFTQKVPEIVFENNGFLIYAGGDDVLAVLPLEDAIPCATELRQHYLNCFKEGSKTETEKRKAIPTTLSGAIEFAHIKMPLTKVLQDSHKLLDDVAKESRGRDALAVRVWKPGGLQLEWSEPWDVAVQGSKNGLPVICEIAEDFQKNNEKDADFSNKFFFKIRERFAMLNPQKNASGQLTKSILSFSETVDLMAMEYLNSWGSSKHKDIQNAKTVIHKLLTQCSPIKREKDKEIESWQPVDGNGRNALEADAALLVRFLSQKGVEKQ